MKTGLLFGSFNPVHIGHLIVGDHFIAQGLLEEVWLVISPQNPFKQTQNLLDVSHRLAMLRLAVEGSEGIRVCDVELSMPVPSYTSNTLRKLSEDFPDRRFSLIIGDDLVADFHRWKDSEWLSETFPVLVFPRLYALEDGQPEPAGDSRMIHVQAPRIGISSTYVRARITEGRSIRYLVPDAVRNYILTKGIYHG